MDMERKVEALPKELSKKCDGQGAVIAGTKIGAKMPDGSLVTNVYEAFEAGKRAAGNGQLKALLGCVEGVMSDMDSSEERFRLQEIVQTFKRAIAAAKEPT